MTILKFEGFWDWTGSISWNLVSGFFHKMRALRSTCEEQERPRTRCPLTNVWSPGAWMCPLTNVPPAGTLQTLQQNHLWWKLWEYHSLQMQRICIFLAKFWHQLQETSWYGAQGTKCAKKLLLKRLSKRNSNIPQPPSICFVNRSFSMLVMSVNLHFQRKREIVWVAWFAQNWIHAVI